MDITGLKNNIDNLEHQIVRLHKAVDFHLGVGPLEKRPLDSFTDSELMSHLHAISYNNSYQFKSDVMNVMKPFLGYDDSGEVIEIDFGDFQRLFGLIDNDFVFTDQQKNIIRSVLGYFESMRRVGEAPSLRRNRWD